MRWHYLTSAHPLNMSFLISTCRPPLAWPLFINTTTTRLQPTRRKALGACGLQWLAAVDADDDHRLLTKKQSVARGKKDWRVGLYSQSIKSRGRSRFDAGNYKKIMPICLLAHLTAFDRVINSHALDISQHTSKQFPLLMPAIPDRPPRHIFAANGSSRSHPTATPLHMYLVKQRKII